MMSFSYCMLIYIEKEITKEFCIDSITDVFPDLKKRRALLYIFLLVFLYLFNLIFYHVH